MFSGLFAKEQGQFSPKTVIHTAFSGKTSVSHVHHTIFAAKGKLFSRKKCFFIILFLFFFHAEAELKETACFLLVFLL